MKQIVTIILLYTSLVLQAQVDVPDAPVFQSASVVPGASPGEVILKWSPSDSLDVKGYYIFKVNSEGITNYLDTVYGRLTTTYTNTASLANGQTETYRLAAFDTLDNISLLTAPHTTVYAFPYYDKCSLEVNLDWNAYDGWSSIESYNIYRRKTGNSYSLIGNVEGSLTNYIDDNLEPNEQYCYYVEAVRADGIKATSNQTCVFTSSHTPPAFLNADYASVESGQIKLSFTADTAGEVIEYKLQRAIDTPSGWSNISTLNDVNSIKLLYTDADVQPDLTKYFYRLQAIDPCNNVSATSNIASNIILKAATDEQLTHYLEWDAYQEWQGDIQSYHIVRHYGDDAPQSIQSLGAETLRGSVNISSYVNDKHNQQRVVPYTYCYYIMATEDASTNPIGIQGVSKSNEVCVSHQPRVYIPNAFFPNSYNMKNRIFKPVVSFAMETGYEFIVYDRWGSIIFRTTDQTEGWDGSTGRREAPPGRYVYLVNYTDFLGESYQKSGIFLLYSD